MFYEAGNTTPASMQNRQQMNAMRGYRGQNARPTSAKGPVTQSLRPPGAAPSTQQGTMMAPPKGCTVLRGFAPGSSVLNAGHKRLLYHLATRIIRQKNRVINVTGFSIKSRTGATRVELSRRRALSVIVQLKKYLAKLKPGAEKTFGFRIYTKVSPQQWTGPESRRVVICSR
jgi:outer membrane protein OmpA-like peptidoglycan-associated protein